MEGPRQTTAPKVERVGDFEVHSGLTVSGHIQYEHWRFPILSPVGESNVTTAFQLTYHPKLGVR